MNNQQIIKRDLTIIGKLKVGESYENTKDVPVQVAQNTADIQLLQDRLAELENKVNNLERILANAE